MPNKYWGNNKMLARAMAFPRKLQQKLHLPSTPNLDRFTGRFTGRSVNQGLHSSRSARQP